MKTVGSSVNVTFKELGDTKMTAKVDTGAHSGALSCSDIYMEKKDDLYVLFFKPAGSNKHYSTNKFRVLTVRSSNGTEEQRFSILTDVELEGEKYRMRISLANRSGMKFPVLIGSRFLRRHKFIVDLSKK